jgi:DNA gyrase subunit A
LREVEGEDGGLLPDELVAARLVSDDDDLMLVSRKGQSIRFSASDTRPMGRATSGVKGMRFRDEDELLAADVIAAGTPAPETDDDEIDGEAETAELETTASGPFSLVVTEGGYAKRTDVSKYRRQGRGGLGIKVAKLQDERGDLVGALLVDEADEVLVIMESGKVMRAYVSEVPAKGRDTMGVILAKPAAGDRIIGIARNVERHLDGDEPLEGAEGATVPEAIDAATIEEAPEG